MEVLHRWLFSVIAAFGLIVALVLPGIALANHSLWEISSIGPSGTNAPIDAVYVGNSADGDAAFFTTSEQLVGTDTDSASDIYERSGGITTLISTGPQGGNGPYYVCPPGGFFPCPGLAVSADGKHVVFATEERLTSNDTDTRFDLYERSAGTTKLVSTGPNGGNADLAVCASTQSACGLAISDDGSHILFENYEALTSDDTDYCGYAGSSCNDVFDRTGGTTKLVSTAPGNPDGAFNAFLEDISADGAHVFFQTFEPMLNSDTDTSIDVYDRSGGGTTQVSSGPVDENPGNAFLHAVSPDGTRAVISTTERLVSEDTDNFNDVYLHTSATTTLISTSPDDDDSGFAIFAGASRDLSHVAFFTSMQLVTEDMDSQQDVYERSNGNTSLISIGPSGGNGAFDVCTDYATCPVMVSDDGAHVFFTTSEPLVSGDTDTGCYSPTGPVPCKDVYERFGSTTALVSTGPTDTAATTEFMRLRHISSDGARAIFQANVPLVAQDGDGYIDVYERAAGTTTILSANAVGGQASFNSFFFGASEDVSRIFVWTNDQLVSGDNDSSHRDVYAVSTTHPSPSYATPQQAPSLRVSLVPAFKQCGAGLNSIDAQHSPPLGPSSCNPPLPGSAVALFGTASVASAVLTAIPGDGDPSNGDQADVSIASSLTDIQAAAGGDYVPDPAGPDLTLTARLRITDLSNGAFKTDAATATDLDFPVPIDCASTSNPTVGSTCAVDSSADALMPGSINEGKSAILQSFRLRVNDAGADGLRGNPDDRIFSTQGIFLP